jgi:hypothetical protein
MTEANKHMLAITDKQAVPWEQFMELIADRREMEFGSIEQKRCEKCSLQSGLENDVTAWTVIVSWSNSLILVLKEVGRSEWRLAYSGHSIAGLFRTLPDRSQLVFTLESDDIC